MAAAPPDDDSFESNSYYSPGRNQPGFVQAEDGSWVPSSFYAPSRTPSPTPSSSPSSRSTAQPPNQAPLFVGIPAKPKPALATKPAARAVIAPVIDRAREQTYAEMPKLRPASVTQYTRGARRCAVLVDGDTVDQSADVLIPVLRSGDRVMVLFIKPQGLFVMGKISPDQVVPVNALLINSWAPYSTYQPPYYYRDISGIVHVKGVGSGGARGTVAFNITPAEWRPAALHRCGDFSGTAAAGAIDIGVDGNVTILSGGIAGFFAIDTSYLSVG